MKGENKRHSKTSGMLLKPIHLSETEESRISCVLKVVRPCMGANA